MKKLIANTTLVAASLGICGLGAEVINQGLNLRNQATAAFVGQKTLDTSISYDKKTGESENLLLLGGFLEGAGGLALIASGLKVENDFQDAKHYAPRFATRQ